MKITTVGNKAVITRAVEITDGTVRTDPYSSTGRKYRVTRLVITYKWYPSRSRWDATGVYDVDVIGTVLKKDGTDSANIFKGHPQRDYKTGGFTEEWKWVERVVDLLRPLGQVHLPDAEIELEA